MAVDSKRKALGRGLSALLPAGDGTSSSGIKKDYFLCPIENIFPNKYQPRKVFNDLKLTELVNSVREKGILQPLIVRAHDKDKYELIAGERRWRAAQKVGLKEVPVLIKEASQNKALLAMQNELHEHMIIKCRESEKHKRESDKRARESEMREERTAKKSPETERRMDRRRHQSPWNGDGQDCGATAEQIGLCRNGKAQGTGDFGLAQLLELYLYLVSDLSRGVTGEVIYVDGGYHVLGA